MMGQVAGIHVVPITRFLQMLHDEISPHGRIFMLRNVVSVSDFFSVIKPR